MISPPHGDLSELQTKLDRKLFAIERPIARYVQWSLEEGLIQSLARRPLSRLEDICNDTKLNENGANALLGILCALGLAFRDSGSLYRLTSPAQEFLIEDSPYFIGRELSAPRESIPGAYLRRPPRLPLLWSQRLRLKRGVKLGSRERLQNQHTRNLPSCVIAASTGEFDSVTFLVDIAGGSGTFSIPFAQRNPGARVVLADLPAAVPEIRKRLAAAGFRDRIEVVPADVLVDEVALPECDGMFVGNFIHGFRDDVCRVLCTRLSKFMKVGGRIWVHEAVWDEDRNGPLITAAWDAAIRVAGGMQRSASEISQLLTDSGLVDPRVTRTRGPYALVSATKPKFA